MDRTLIVLLGGVLALLAAASAVAAVLGRIKPGPVVANLAARIKAWWIMVGLFGIALATGGVGSIVLFALVSFFALREYITLTHTRAGDHRALFWAFFVVVPAQYLLIGVHWYGLFTIFIPVYAFILLPARSAAAGDCERFLERTSTMQWGLMVCVYFVSYVPALLTLEIPGRTHGNAALLLFFVLVVQLSDVFQYVWGKLFGRRKIAPTVSPNKTLEGFFGGVLTATGVGAALWWATPFDPLRAALFALVTALMGFFGGLVMSAIKRDRGVKDFGTLIEGHGGMLDRIDSICFAAPIFFHLVRFYYT